MNTGYYKHNQVLLVISLDNSVPSRLRLDSVILCPQFTEMDAIGKPVVMDHIS